MARIGKTVEAKVDAVPLQDDEIISFLESLPIESNHPRDKEAAKRWKFAFQLMAAYGLRPIKFATIIWSLMSNVYTFRSEKCIC